MKRWIIDMLQCPHEKCGGGLSIEVFDSHDVEIDGEIIEEIDEALLICDKCGRWYPVIDRITCMMPDDKRLEGKQYIEETRFLERWKDRIPSEILKNGKPFGLKSE